MLRDLDRSTLVVVMAANQLHIQVVKEPVESQIASSCSHKSTNKKMIF